MNPPVPRPVDAQVGEDGPGMTRPVAPNDVLAWFSAPVAVEHYARAAASLGLWRSEEIVLGRSFASDDRLLDVGCGAGRIALGLWRLGYRHLTGVDFCPAMIAEARRLAAAHAAEIAFEVGDALALRFGDATFDGVVFGFNGLMQIPGRDRRRRALAELRRVVRPGGRLVFTTHDRDHAMERRWWERERARWAAGQQPAGLGEFGDRVLVFPEGRVFMHLPDRGEILADLSASGWTWEFDAWRSRLANEPAAVREFSDECRFWIARRGAEGRKVET